MSNYQNLKNEIANTIKANGNNDIDGALLQEKLLEMVDSLGKDYKFRGVATPDGEPITDDTNVFYVANTVGAYPNYGGLSVADGEIAFFTYNGNWRKVALEDVASRSEVEAKVAKTLGKTYHYSYNYKGGAENYILPIDIVKGDVLLVKITSDVEFSIVISVRTATGYLVKGIATNNNIVAFTITEDIAIENLYFTNGSEHAFSINVEIAKSIDGVIIGGIEQAIEESNKNREIINDIAVQHEYSFVKNYSLLTKEEKNVASCIKGLVLRIDETLATSDLYLRAFGVYQHVFYIFIWDKNTNTPVAEYFENINQLNNGLVSLSVLSDRLNAIIIVDMDKVVNTSFLNRQDNNLSLVINDIVTDGTFKIKSQVKPNLFSLDDASYGQYMASTGVVNESSGFIMSNYIKVTPGKIYKCSTGIPFINFFNSAKERTRGFIQYDTPNYFIPEDGEFYVVISVSVSNFEIVMVQEVASLSDDFDFANLAIKPNDYLTEGGYASFKVTGDYFGKFTTGHKDNTGSTISLVAEKKLFATSLVGKYYGKITKLEFYCECDAPFYMTLGLGDIDQRNWGLVSREFNVVVVNGYNSIIVNQEIKENERLFIVANNTSSSVNARLFVGGTGLRYESEDEDIVMTKKNGFIAIEYVIEGKRVMSDSRMVTKGELDAAVADVNASIDSISLDSLYLTSPNGAFFKLNVSNTGELQTSEIPVQGTMLIMGNSYDVHDYVEGLWWGDFGMAASRKENDWKHQLLTKLRKNDGLIYEFEKQSLASWETTWNKTSDLVEDTFEYSDETLPAFANGINYSMVIIRVGENNTDTNYPRVQLRLRRLLNYIISKVGADTPILLGACVKIRTEQNSSFELVAAEYDNVTYVDITPAGRLDTFAAGLDYRVFGDDNKWHIISESSMASAVAGHPNDAVFAKMAELFYPVVLSKL